MIASLSIDWSIQLLTLPQPLTIAVCPTWLFASPNLKDRSENVWKKLNLIITAPGFTLFHRRKADRQHLRKHAFSWFSPLGKVWRLFLVQSMPHHGSFPSRASSKKIPLTLASGPLKSLFAGPPQIGWDGKKWRKTYDCSTHSLLCRPRTTVRRLGSFVTSNPLAQPSMPSWFLKQWAAVSTWRLSIDALINTEIQYTIDAIG